MSNAIVEFSLVYHSRNGTLNFEELVLSLEDKGYMLETELSFMRPTYNAARNEDFKKLFAFFYPDKSNSIELRSIGTSKGGYPGDNTYALYNANLVGHKEILDILTKFNQQRFREL